MRQALGRPVLLRCSLLRGSPQRIASAVWRFKGQLLPPPPAVPVAAEAPDHSELRLDAVTRESSGSYECSVSNDVGSAACLFQVSGERPGGPAHPGPAPAQLQPPPNYGPAHSRPGAPPLPPTCSRFRALPCQDPPMPGVVSAQASQIYLGPPLTALPTPHVHSRSRPSRFTPHSDLASDSPTPQAFTRPRLRASRAFGY